jgi:hypothetical protein
MENSISYYRNKLMQEVDLPGNQEKIDVAEPKGKITAADFAKLRSNKDVKEGVDMKELEIELARLKRENPGKKITYDFITNSKYPKGYVIKIDGKIPDEKSIDISKVMKEEDHEVSMANNSIETIIKAAMELKTQLGNNEKNIPAWIQDHISKAENYITQASQNYHEYGDHEVEDIPVNGALEKIMEKVLNKK